MGDFDQANFDATVKSAWADAEGACFNYLCYLTSCKQGYNAFIGDNVADSTKKNIWAFMLSGGREQTQNYQCSTPNKKFLVDGYLNGIFEKREEALFLSSTIMNGLPAYWTDDETGAVANRGLAPNVGFFELTYHPECFSNKIDNGKRYWTLEMRFRVEYTDSET